MAEVVASVALEVAKCLVGPIGRGLSYLRNYTSNFENLKIEVEKLTDAKDSTHKKIVAASKKGDEIEKRVEKWLINVEQTIDVANKLIEDKEKANKRFLKGLCLNLKMRYQLSKKAAMEVKTIVGLKGEAEKFDQISYCTVPEEAWLESSKGYEAFESRILTLRNIRSALSGPDVSIIGVYGMAGVGKTTLAKEVARQAKKDKLFDEVVFAEVSQSANIKRIQKEIAEKLSLELHEETESRRASRLRARLKNEKKILIILDNIWNYLDLETVGIPLGDDHGGCKVLLTARDRNVLLGMGSKDNFSIGILSEQETWRLFKKMTGDYVENHPLKSTAVDVAKACGGLPIAITTIARALRNKSELEWKTALHELRTPSLGNFEGVPTEAYSTIELSYKYLKGELKKTLLLCSIMACPTSILDLFKYSMGMGMFQGVNRMEDARNKLHKLVYELKDSCLLLEDNSEMISMHDVVRAVAISIAYREQHVFVVRNEDVWDWPDKDILEKCTAICLTDSSIGELPEGLECPQLEFFLLRANYSFVEIPENFFAGMRKLRVVDLTEMRLMSLPSSLDVLTNLRTLCLDFGMFKDIAIVGKLKNLEILSFMGSDIVQLPEELGQLTKLKVLDLSDCAKLKVIAPNVISSLTRLEELNMRNCFVQWEVEGLSGERSNASLNELMRLPRLTSLAIDVKDDKILPNGFFSKKLVRYCISIGDVPFGSFPFFGVGWWFRFSWARYFSVRYEASRTLILKLDSKTISSENLQGVNNAEFLCLDKLQGVKNVLFELDREGFKQLKYLSVQNNQELLCIVDSMETAACDAFPLLESLTLYNLINLEKICHYQLITESFDKLSAITVNNCAKLKNIFSFCSTKCLPRLQRIAIINCENMEEIFGFGGEDDANSNQELETTEFAQLSCLSLGTLPQLSSFYGKVKIASISQNRQGELITSTPLFNKVVLPNLDALELCEINVENIWHGQFPATSPSCFQLLTRLIIWNCHNLKYIFSSSIVRSFKQLQHLEICGCLSLQEIVAEAAAEQANPSFVFPQLTSLVLRNLPELRSFYPGMHTSEWPELKKLEAYSCDRVKVFGSELFHFQTSEEIQPVQQPLLLAEKVFPNLEELKLSGNDITMIWHSEFPEELFGRLKVLEILNDNSADFQLGFLERFHNIEYFALTNCLYTEIFSNGAQLDKKVGKLAQIKSLRLSGLRNLTHLWKQDSKLDLLFKNLEILLVFDCLNVINLFPSPVSFQNLTELQVCLCEELKNLVTFSMAKSLTRLVSIMVFGCSKMTEVVVCEGDTTKQEIIFSKLKSLSLFGLESLTSFCAGNCSFKFPALKELVVIGCPNMKTFTGGGDLSAPNVPIEYGKGVNEWCVDSDLNTTIQQLHEQKLLGGSPYAALAMELIQGAYY